MINEALKKAVPSPPPLRKRDKQERVYTRPQIIQEKLTELLTLSRDEVLSRCKISDRDSPGYVPSECLLHLLRACRNEPSGTYLETICKTLLGRITSRFRAGTGQGDSPVALTDLLISEEVVDQFTELLMKDRHSYFDRLDFYEVRFDRSLKLLAITAKEKVWKEANRSAPLQDPESGEIFADVDEAAGAFDPFQTEDLHKKDYQSGLEAAITRLPPEQKRIVTMLNAKFTIGSKDPEIITIAKALQLSEKTVRTHRNKAFASIRSFLAKGDAP